MNNALNRPQSTLLTGDGQNAAQSTNPSSSQHQQSSQQQQSAAQNQNKLDEVLLQSKDAQTMISVLKDMGIDEFEPRVINQLLEFSYSKFYILIQFNVHVVNRF
jgi:hypothetical protein